MLFRELTNFLFRRYLRQNLLLCLGLLIMTPIQVSVVAGWGWSNPAYGIQPYENLLALSGVGYVFAGALFLQALLLCARYFRDYVSPGAMDTLLLLPMPRRRVLLAFIAAGVVSVLLLFAAQALALVYSYPVAVAASERAMAAHPQLPYSAARTNGLFLAMLRSGVFRVVLPVTPLEGLHTAMAILLLGALPALTLFPERRRLNYMLSTAVYSGMLALALCLRILRLTQSTVSYGMMFFGNFYPGSLGLLFFCSVYPLVTGVLLTWRNFRQLGEGGTP